MILRKYMKDRKTMTRIGAGSMLIALLSQWFLRPVATAHPDAADGIRGLLFGVAIA
jgi:hypothetical protein